MIDSPFVVFAIALLVQWGAAYAGDFLGKRIRPIEAKERDDLDTVLTATLTLFALIVGFTFSMAVTRYDLRKTYEEAEANAIGTEYLRADLLPAEDGTRLRALLRTYVDQRILFFLGKEQQIKDTGPKAERLQAELWSTVVHVSSAQPTPIVALVVGGMNDVLNAQGYTQAAWSNRIPFAAWTLMGLIAIFANLLLGYRERSSGRLAPFVLPVITSIAFFLIADIDSPNGGVIHVAPQNLILTSQSMKAP
jgi:hypothetical protein